jgi:hypothetical protein
VYAAIDAVVVCLVCALTVWLRFGVAVPIRTQRQSFDHLAGQVYAGFFLLYAAVIVLDYIRRWTPMLDIQILVKTASEVFAGSGK